MHTTRLLGLALLVCCASSCEIHMPPNQNSESNFAYYDSNAMRGRVCSLIDQGRYDEASALLSAMRDQDPDGYDECVEYSIYNVHAHRNGESAEEAAYRAESARILLVALESGSANSRHLAKLQEQRQKAEIEAEKFDARQRALAAKRAEHNRDQAAAFARNEQRKQASADRKDERRDDRTERSNQRRDDNAQAKDAKRDDQAARQAAQAQKQLEQKRQADAAQAAKRAQQERERQAKAAEQAAKKAAQDAERLRKQQEQQKKKKNG